ncbi:SGNH/GDSL hydrolase family protein [Actinocorallia sp. API 0066]|uniref:SGNH/GDSL hydrolase family protein n=1 Tax=Actinocorallia sp. API 0066 TaxID=2896846 RepID=UPI001E2B28D9|nr:SGNH/GDSL hydrolase family protein [Actinocorallia sp. API 0066]MCD0449799.1 SGNH/GDSL hydrolase family protein [Actinocorallia sp. API 0066]
MKVWKRMAVIGDSVAEGVREPVEGYEDLSWIDLINRSLGTVTLNLGKRDLRAHEVRETQLDAALAFDPDLAVVTCGANDAFRRSFDPEAVQAELDTMIGAFRKTGADVITLGLFDIVNSGLVTDPGYLAEIRPRFLRLNELTAEVAHAQDALFVNFRNHPAGADKAIYASDLVHLNARGHAIVAAETLAHLKARAADSRPA